VPGHTSSTAKRSLSSASSKTAATLSRRRVPHPRAARVGLSFLKAFCVIPSPARGGINSAGNLSSIYYWTKICVGIRLQSTYFSCGLIRRKCCAVLTVQPRWRSLPDSAHRAERPRVRFHRCRRRHPLLSRARAEQPQQLRWARVADLPRVSCSPAASGSSACWGGMSLLR